MRSFPGLVLGWIVGSTALACGGEDDEGLEVEEGDQAEAFCRASCERDLECYQTATLRRCMDHCVPALTGLERVRPAAVEIVAECIGEIPCDALYLEGSLTPCWDRAEATLVPGPVVRAFCAEWATRWFECGSSYSTDECERDWGTWDDEFLLELGACTAESCELIGACSSALIGGP